MKRVECWWNGLDGSAARWIALLTDGRRWQVAVRDWTGAGDAVEYDEEAVARSVLVDWRARDRRGRRWTRPPEWRPVT